MWISCRYLDSTYRVDYETPYPYEQQKVNNMNEFPPKMHAHGKGLQLRGSEIGNEMGNRGACVSPDPFQLRIPLYWLNVWMVPRACQNHDLGLGGTEYNVILAVNLPISTFFHHKIRKNGCHHTKVTQAPLANNSVLFSPQTPPPEQDQSALWRRCHSQFTDVDDYRRHGRNTWHDESGVYANSALRDQVIKPTNPIPERPAWIIVNY